MIFRKICPKKISLRIYLRTFLKTFQKMMPQRMFLKIFPKISQKISLRMNLLTISPMIFQKTMFQRTSQRTMLRMTRTI